MVMNVTMSQKENMFERVQRIIFLRKCQIYGEFWKKGGGWGTIPWGRDSRRALKAGGAIGWDHRRGGGGGERYSMEKKEERERKKKWQQLNRYVEKGVSLVGTLLCYRVPMSLVPFCPLWHTPSTRGFIRAPPSLMPCCTPRASGWMTWIVCV
jgi:hypothetical protein